MKFDISEISGILKRELQPYQARLDVARVGRVVEVGDGIARIYGLDHAMAGEMLGPMLLSIHNLTYYQRLLADARAAIEADRFEDFRRKKLDGWKTR